tara:strand:- start:192 stop:362 length:171 start_codon:yes stop_codon:yes gene_type:complete
LPPKAFFVPEAHHRHLELVGRFAPFVFDAPYCAAQDRFDLFGGVSYFTHLSITPGH